MQKLFTEQILFHPFVTAAPGGPCPDTIFSTSASNLETCVFQRAEIKMISVVSNLHIASGIYLADESNLNTQSFSDLY